MKNPYKYGPSAHFTWHEVNPHNFSGLGPILRANAIRHAKRLEKLRTEVNKRRLQKGLPPTGIGILSWWRPKWYNEKIHGAKKSQHIKALATDFSLTEVRRLMPWSGGRMEFDRLCDKIFKEGGFGQYPAGDRHVDTRGWRARWTSF